MTISVPPVLTRGRWSGCRVILAIVLALCGFGALDVSTGTECYSLASGVEQSGPSCQTSVAAPGVAAAAVLFILAVLVLRSALRRRR